MAFKWEWVVCRHGFGLGLVKTNWSELMISGSSCCIGCIGSIGRNGSIDSIGRNGWIGSRGRNRNWAEWSQQSIRGDNLGMDQLSNGLYCACDTRTELMTVGDDLLNKIFYSGWLAKNWWWILILNRGCNRASNSSIFDDKIFLSEEILLDQSTALLGTMYWEFLIPFFHTSLLYLCLPHRWPFRI